MAEMNLANNSLNLNSRYYLHHHAPNHHHHTSFSSFKRHMSVSSLSHLVASHSRPKLSSPLEKSKKNVKFMSAVYLTDQRHDLQDDLQSVHDIDKSLDQSMLIIKDHAFVKATCTKLKQFCETCQCSVHAHNYWYCKNCPVVIHNKIKCQHYLTRLCPTKTLKIQGWGEGRQIYFIQLNLKLIIVIVFFNKQYLNIKILKKTINVRFK